MAETVLVSPEEILAGKAPLTCKVTRRKDGRVALELEVEMTSKTKGYFEGFDLRVLKKPVAAPEIKEHVFRAELLAWHRPSSRSHDLFVLTEEEIATAYVITRWSLPSDSNGAVQVRSVCFAVKALVDASKK